RNPPRAEARGPTGRHCRNVQRRNVQRGVRGPDADAARSVSDRPRTRGVAQRRGLCGRGASRRSSKRLDLRGGAEARFDPRCTAMTIVEPDLLRDVADRCTAYLLQAPTRRVSPSDASLAGLRALAMPLPEAPMSPHDIVALLDRLGSPATTTTPGGRYYG